MVNKKITTLVSDDPDGEESVITEMCAAMDDLQRQNQTLEENVHHIPQRHQTNNMVEKGTRSPSSIGRNMGDTHAREMHATVVG